MEGKRAKSAARTDSAGTVVARLSGAFSSHATGGRAVTVSERVDDFQRRHTWIGLPLAVLYKFVDDNGPYLASLITYYGFVSVFPLLLLLNTVLGYALHDDARLQQDVLHSALSQFPIIGDQIEENIHSLHGSALGVVLGLVGCLYGGLGVANAAQYAANTMWSVPYTARPNPAVLYGRSLLLLVAVGLELIITMALAALTVAGAGLGNVLGSVGTILVRVGAAAVAVALNTGLFLVVFRVLAARRLTVRQVLPGAIGAAVGWQLLQEGGTYYVDHELRGVSATYGLFGIVLGLVAWIYLGAMVFLFCTEINVVRTDRLWPRSLLTLFTDHVRLTRGDQRAYRRYATAEQRKAMEQVRVRFDEPHDSQPD
jgi:inner membrane protein YhjD